MSFKPEGALAKYQEAHASTPLKDKKTIKDDIKSIAHDHKTCGGKKDGFVEARLGALQWAHSDEEGWIVETRVLNGGFVRLVDQMGGDGAVVQAARVSYDHGSKGPEQDRKLINYLLKHHHGTPFEQALLKFHVSAPIFVARQWFRHRLGTFDEGGQGLVETSGHSINEISYRYTEVKETFYVPHHVRRPSSSDRQASAAGAFANESELLLLFEQANQQAYACYKRLLEAGVTREQARSVLPVGTYTQFYWTCNARSLMNWLSLRADEHAQSEIRAYAEPVAKAFQTLMPWTFQAFLNHAWHGKSALLERLRLGW